jgi:transcriptional regulator with XRE-family HTH domain
MLLGLRWHLGDVLRKIRENRTPRLTIKTLAKQAHVNKATISILERSENRARVVQRDTLEKIAHGLGYALADIEEETRRLVGESVEPEQEIPEEKARHPAAPRGSGRREASSVRSPAEGTR